MSQEADRARENIRRWLVEEHLFADSIDKGTTYFNFVAKHTQTLINIVHQLHRPDAVDLGTRLVLTEVERRAYAALDESERRRVLHKLIEPLLMLGCSFTIEPLPEMYSRIESVRIETTIYFSDLTKQRFMDAVNLLARAVLFLNIRLDELFGERVINGDPLHG